jgi:opacity protein-like surface antigen
MRQFSGRRVVRTGILMTAVLAAWITPARAQQTRTNVDQREIQVRILGGSTRFSKPMHSVDDLRTMVNTNRTQLNQVLTMAGLANISTQVLDALTTGDMTDASIAPGTHLEWMALKRSGSPGLLRNVRWAGRQSFDAFQFTVNARGFGYTFVVPKVCGNISLLTTIATPVAAATEAPRPAAPPPPPPPPSPIVEAPPAPAPPPPPPQPAPVAAVAEVSEPWIASGFIGNYFNASAGVESPDILGDTDTINRSLAFGGTIAYLWRENFGAEFLADFAPTFKANNVLFANHPKVNSYMFNAIYGLKVGSGGRLKPYVSGGLGGINMHADLITLGDLLTPNIDLNTTSRITASQTRFGGDVGAGLLGYVGRIGVRADLRYFKASRDSNLDINVDNRLLDDSVTLVELSGLKFWRSSLGLAFRW